MKNVKKQKRNVGIQAIVQSKEYISPSVAITHNLETEDYPKLFTIPHNIFAFIIVASILFWFSRTTTGNFINDSKKGLIFIIFIFLAFGALYLPDSILRRPHPIFWRLILALSILYLFFTIFILFQNREQAWIFLKYFDSDLGEPLKEKNYASQCDLLTNNFPYFDLEKIYNCFDIFLIAHLCGWFVKMLAVRDVYLCWFLSIFFEFLEITFRHWLPNFWECWWDHVILDILICNGLGIWLGSIVCNYFDMKNYKWIIRNNNKIINMSFLDYFQPNIWVKHDWNIFSSTKRFLAVLWYIVFLNLVDLSNFFLKYLLYLPPSHYIMHVRIYIWGLLAMMSTREYYEYLTNSSYKRIGQFLWISHLILFSELSIILKFSSGYFTESFPIYVKYIWAMIFTLILGIIISLLAKDLIYFFKKGVNEENIDLIEPAIDVEYVNE